MIADQLIARWNSIPVPVAHVTAVQKDKFWLPYLPMGCLLANSALVSECNRARIARRMKTILVTSVTGDLGKEGAKGISPQF
jgi:hypothetical protein